MQSSRVPCVLLLAMFVGCVESEATESDVLAVTLPAGNVIAHAKFVDGDDDGRGDNFGGGRISGKADKVRYRVDGEGRQRIGVTLAPCPPPPAPCGFGAGGDGRVALFESTREAAPGQYYKGWLRGRTANSNNNGNGICDDDGKSTPGREQFRTQLKIWYLGKDGPDRDDEREVIGSCYCNVCPRETADRTMSKCNTSQWSVKTSLSDDGACKAPPGTARVRFAIIGLARDRQPDAKGELLGPEATGTAIFDRFVFARCGNDGFCDSANINTATAWY